MRLVRRSGVFASWLAAALALATPLVAQDVSQEYRLKAAFVFRFPQFVEWPPRALESRSTIDICVLAPNPFGAALSELAEGESIGERRLVVRYVGGADEVDSCQVVYLPASSPERKTLVARLASRPILTVSDAPRFLDEGGMVQLRVVASRVRFDISAAAAERAGLRLSAQLLRLAMNVRGGPA
jgi:hypothetical protein